MGGDVIADDCFVYYRDKVYGNDLKAVVIAIWLKGLVGDLSLQQNDTIGFCDSYNTIHLTKNHLYHGITKHNDARYHFISEIVSQGIIAVKKVATLDSPT